MFIAKMALVALRDDGAVNGKSYSPSAGTTRLVTFKPVTEHSDVPEDKDFSKWTPTNESEVKLLITNPKVTEGLKIGQRYYVTFEEVPEGM